MKINKLLALIISVILVVAFTACSNETDTATSVETDNAANPVEGNSISQEEYDAVVAELETVKAENDKLNEEIEEYKEYDDIINPIRNEDYSGAINAVRSRVPAKENDDSGDTIEVTEEGFIGTWVSSKDQNCSFELCENHEAKIGEHVCIWSIKSNGYGPYGIEIKMDDGKGWYSWIFKDGDPTVLFGNGRSTNIPDYLNPDSFGGADFYKK